MNMSISDEQIEEMCADPELAVWQAIQAYNNCRDFLNDNAIVRRYRPDLEEMAMDLSMKLTAEFVDVVA